MKVENGGSRDFFQIFLFHPKEWTSAQVAFFQHRYTCLVKIQEFTQLSILSGSGEKWSREVKLKILYNARNSTIIVTLELPAVGGF